MTHKNKTSLRSMLRMTHKEHASRGDIHDTTLASVALTLNTRQQRALIVSVILALLAGFLLVRSLFSVILLSLLAAIITYPMYTWLNRKVHRPGMAAMLALLVLLIGVIVPLAITLFITAGQIRTLIEQLAQATGGSLSLTNASGYLLDSINHLLHSLTGGSYQLSAEQLQEYLAKLAASFASFFLGVLTGSFSGIASLTTQFILFIYVYTSMLTNANKLQETFRSLNPLGDEISEVYLKRTGQMTRGVVGGQFLIALCQGIAGAAFLYMAGVHYFFFFVLVLTLLSIVPLGGGILAIPIGIILLLTGNIWQGLFVLLTHFTVIVNIDNILRPRLIPKAIRINSALMMLAVFGGLAAFGFLGIALGPIIMILVLSTVQLYIPLARAHNVPDVTAKHKPSSVATAKPA